jgi:hypothetical protein
MNEKMYYLESNASNFSRSGLIDSWIAFISSMRSLAFCALVSDLDKQSFKRV